MRDAEEFNQRHARGRELVEEFLWRFDGDEDYRALACHAALPLILPPALLKFLRHEFLPHLSWVAEVDLLLSKLCDEAAEDVYVMKREPRAFLIDEMRRDPLMGEPRIEAVNRLLIGSLGYLMRSHPGILPNEWRAQHWSAMLYVADRRDEAARALAEAIYRCVVRGGTGAGAVGTNDSQAELMRLTRLVRDAAASLQDYPDLVRLAELTGRIMADRSGQFAEHLRQSGQLAQTFRLPGVPVELPLERLTLLGPAKGARLTPTPPATPNASPPRQLPPRLPDFTGMEMKLEWSANMLRTIGLHISGPGGTGKTTLAVELAYRLSDRYPDAQLYLDLGGETQSPLTAAQALAQAVRALQPADKLPDDEAALRELYQSLLQGRRALLVLDNAADLAQIEPLFPPQDCGLIVASRIDPEGAFEPRLRYRRMDTLVLDSMTPGDARAFLLKLAPRIGDDMADRIAELCNSLPLALRVAGTTLATHAELPVEDYLKHLTAALERSKALWQTCLPPVVVSYERLTPERQKQWAALAVLPQPFGAENAANVWRTSNEEAAAALSDLAANGLLEFNGADGRFRMHALLAEYAQSRPSVVGATTAQKRHAAHMLDVLGQANDEYLKGGDSIFSALDTFDKSWENIKAAQARASEAAGRDEEAAKLCVAFPLAGEYLLDLRLPPHEHRDWLEQALASAERIKSPDLWHVLANLAHVNATLGEPMLAVQFYQQALTYAREQGDASAEGYILNNLGSNYLRLGDSKSAESLFSRALGLTRETGNRRAEGQTLSNMGRLVLTLGDFNQARLLFEEHLDIALQLGDLRGHAQALGNLGLAALEFEQHTAAVQLFNSQLEMTRRLGDAKGEGYALENLIRVYSRIRRRGEAIAAAEGALRIFEQLKLPESESVRQFLSDMQDPATDVRGKPLKIYLDYSRQDMRFKDELLTYLKAAGLGAPVEFEDLPVTAGVPWVSAYKEIIGSADILLLLLSAAFLATPERREGVFRAATKSRYTVFVPVFLSPFEAQSLWLSQIQCLPRDGRPVTDWDKREDAFRDIAEGLRAIITRLRDAGQGDSPPGGVEVDFKVLAEEYEGIRARMPQGPERTRRMGAVVEQMEKLAASAGHLVPDFAASDSAGLRLAAVVILKESPDPQFLNWLADRLKVEKPFIGYQAARALRSAVQHLDPTFREKLWETLSEAIRALGPGRDNTDRYQMLIEAQSLLRQSRTNRYFNPPRRVREVGRKLAPGDYDGLTGQLEAGECLVGLCYNRGTARVATHIQSQARKDEVERLYQRVGYYALPLDAANEMTDSPFPTVTKESE